MPNSYNLSFRILPSDGAVSNDSIGVFIFSPNGGISFYRNGECRITTPNWFLLLNAVEKARGEI